MDWSNGVVVDVASPFSADCVQGLTVCQNVFGEVRANVG